MNLWKKIRTWRKRKQELGFLSQCSGVFGSLQRLERKGLLLWDEKERRLFICEPLAVLMMRSRDSWKAFLTNIALWRTYTETRQRWDDYIRNEELLAVRRAKRRYVSLTKADMNRIRRGRREEIEQSELNTPTIDKFEFFILADSVEMPLSKVPKDKKAAREVGVVAVGDYNVDTGSVDMALWEDVEQALKSLEEQKNV